MKKPPTGGAVSSGSNTSASTWSVFINPTPICPDSHDPLNDRQRRLAHWRRDLDIWRTGPPGIPMPQASAYGLDLAPPAGPFNPDPTIPLVDLLTFRIEVPRRWWLRCGRYGLVLGKDQLVDAMAEGRSCRLHETPLRWLEAACEGACPLDLAEAYALIYLKDHCCPVK